MKKRMFIKENKFILLIALLLVVVIISGCLFSGKAFKSQYKGQIATYDASGESETLTFNHDQTTLTLEIGGIPLDMTLNIKKTDSEGQVSWQQETDLTGYTVNSTDTQVASVGINGACVEITPGSKSGLTTVTATNSSKGLTATLSVTINEQNLPDSVEIVQYPTKRAFEVNEKIKYFTSGGEYRVKFRDGTITNNLSMDDSDIIYPYEAKSTYTDEEGRYAWFEEPGIYQMRFSPMLIGKPRYDWLYKDIDIAILGIKIKPDSIKTNYKKGESLDLDSGKILSTTEEIKTEEISMKDSGVTIEGYDANKIGKQTVTVKYGKYTTTFDVIVSESEEKPGGEDNPGGNTGTEDNKDTELPVITKAEAAKDSNGNNILYITASDNKSGIEKVLVNGKDITNQKTEDGRYYYKLEEDGEYEITIIDKSGNKTEKVLNWKAETDNDNEENNNSGSDSDNDNEGNNNSGSGSDNDNEGNNNSGGDSDNDNEGNNNSGSDSDNDNEGNNNSGSGSDNDNEGNNNSGSDSNNNNEGNNNSGNGSNNNNEQNNNSGSVTNQGGSSGSGSNQGESSGSGSNSNNNKSQSSISGTNGKDYSTSSSILPKTGDAIRLIVAISVCAAIGVYSWSKFRKMKY